MSYFDNALRLRSAYPETPVLMYAIGILFRLPSPSRPIHRIAQSYMLQALLAEPGCAQKVFALLSYWEINGVAFERPLVTRAVATLATLHESRGMSSDLSWAPAFSIQHSVSLPRAVGAIVSEFDDDSVALQAMHASSLNLLPGFSQQRIARALGDETCEGPHWLALYEGVRQGFFTKLSSIVSSDPFFGPLLSANVSFYRNKLPSYALLIHPGGAPDWVVRAWLKGLSKAAAPVTPNVIGADLSKMGATKQSPMDIVRELLDKFSKRASVAPEPYV